MPRTMYSRHNTGDERKPLSSYRAKYPLLARSDLLGPDSPFHRLAAHLCETCHADDIDGAMLRLHNLQGLTDASVAYAQQFKQEQERLEQQRREAEKGAEDSFAPRDPDSYGHDELRQIVGAELHDWQLPTREWAALHETQKSAVQHLRAAFFEAVEEGCVDSDLQAPALMQRVNNEAANDE